MIAEQSAKFMHCWLIYIYIRHTEMMYCNDELKLMVVEEVDKREEDVV